MVNKTMTGGVNKMVAMIAGAVLALVGLLGFVPALITDGALLGLFEVNAVHNVVHLLSGIVLLGAAFMDNGANSRITLLVIGVVYAIVAVAGFAVPDLVAPLMGDAADNAFLYDNVLHAVLAIAFIAVPLLVKEGTMRPMRGSPGM